MRQPLKDVYFDNATTDDYLPHANVSMLYLLSSIAVVILIMTIFNYVNLTISTSYQRLKEVGIKKTTGATGKNIFLQFLNESLIVTALSFLLALIIASFLAPVLSGILGKDIRIDMLIFSPEAWFYIFLVFAVTGIVSGIFPAIIFSRYSPLQMVTQKLKIVNNS